MDTLEGNDLLGLLDRRLEETLDPVNVSLSVKNRGTDYQSITFSEVFYHFRCYS